MSARDDLVHVLVDYFANVGGCYADSIDAVTDALSEPSVWLAALVEEHGRDKVLGWLGGERFGSYGPVDAVPVEECWAFPGEEGTDQ